MFATRPKALDDGFEPFADARAKPFEVATPTTLASWFTPRNVMWRVDVFRCSLLNVDFMHSNLEQSRETHMPSYCSFLVFRPDEIDLVESLCAKAEWSTRHICDPSSRFKFTERGVQTTTRADDLGEYGVLRSGEEFGRLLVLEADQCEADNIIDLIGAAYLILKGFQESNDYFFPNHSVEIPNDPIEREEIFRCLFRTQSYFQRFFNGLELPVAVAVAARAWRDKKLIYAIHKLALSYMTESVTPNSMHPSEGQIFEKHTENFSSHVGTSVAINLAYSAIQELGLDIKSSNQKPRWRDKSTFDWNPEVLEDIKKRLEKSGVSCDKTIDWIVRGDASEVEVHPVRDAPTSFYNEETIRDRKLLLPDAINSCEYLRNYLTAHAFSKSTARLGPYEVFNTQNVARLLILSKCGLFNVWTWDLKAGFSKLPT